VGRGSKQKGRSEAAVKAACYNGLLQQKQLVTKDYWPTLSSLRLYQVDPTFTSAGPAGGASTRAVLKLLKPNQLGLNQA